MAQLIDDISNADVTWNGTYVGLVPQLRPETEARVATLGPQDAPCSPPSPTPRSS